MHVRLGGSATSQLTANCFLSFYPSLIKLLSQIRIAIEKMNAGSLLPRQSRANIAFANSDPRYEETITSLATSLESESRPGEESDKSMPTS